MGRNESWAYCISNGQLRESKGGDVKRARASARTSEHDSTNLHVSKSILAKYVIPACTSSHVSDRFVVIVSLRNLNSTCTVILCV